MASIYLKKKPANVNLISPFPSGTLNTNEYACVMKDKIEHVEAYGEIDDGIPAVIVNSYGKGKGILLNFRINNYLRKIYLGESSVQTFMSEVMRRYGPAKYIEINDPKGADLYGYEVIPYVNGDDVYMGIMKRRFKEDEQPEKVRISLSKKFFIYELTEGKFFGFNDVINDITPVGPAKIYALLSSPMCDFKFDIEKRDVYQGDKAGYKIILSSNKRMRFFRLEVENPEGKKCPYFARTIIMKDKKFQDFLPIAFNEHLGKWKVILRDIVSGKVIEKELTIKKVVSK